MSVLSDDLEISKKRLASNSDKYDSENEDKM